VSSTPGTNSELSAVLEPATEFLSLRNLKLESQPELQPETKSRLLPAPESAMSFPPSRELNPVAAFESGLPLRAAPQLDFDSTSAPETNSELSPVSESPTEFPPLRKLHLGSQPQTESNVSPAPDPPVQFLP
jgi:hypothetical protein